MIFNEGTLCFDFRDARKIIKFDDRDHGLSHCMSAVDFVVETNEYYYFIEIKDLDDPAVKNKRAFVEKLQSEKLNQSLVKKFRDTFIYRWAEEKLEKPIYYIVLLCLEQLGNDGLLSQTHNLRKNLPLEMTKKWKRPLVKECVFLSLQSWKTMFPNWHIKRLPETHKET